MELVSSFLLWSLLGGFLLGSLSPLVVKVFKKAPHWSLAIIPSLLVVLFSWIAISLPAHKKDLASYVWVSLFETKMAFAVDGLSLLFCLLISSFGVLIILYGGKYLEGHRDLARFYTTLLVFMMSMLGLVLSDNLLLLFIFWELTTFSSFLLIGFNHEDEKARKSAWQAILITTAGALAMMAGFILLGDIVGSYQISTILNKGEAIRSHPYYEVMLILILAGAFTKSAQFPFHFWLPGAMSAPTPVSAYLHSATMVKAGIYLMARLSPAIAHTDLWMMIVTTIGGLTMLTGSLMALKQDDLKLILAYLTIMALGTLTLLLGIGSESAIKAAMIFLLVHSLYKGGLFLITGSIDHETGTRLVSKLGGLRKKLPFTTLAAFIALISMAGLPPLIGFLGKEMFYKATLGTSGVAAFFIIGMALFSMSVAVGLAGVIFFRVFFGDNKSNQEIHEGGFLLWAPPLFLGVSSLLLGIFSDWMDLSLFSSSVSAIYGTKTSAPMFPGVHLDLTLGLSVISTLLGIAIYFSYSPLSQSVYKLTHALNRFAPANIFSLLMDLFPKLANFQTHLLQKGYHIKYLVLIFTTAILGIGFFLLQGEVNYLPDEFPKIVFYEWVIAVGIIISAVGAILAHTLFGGIILMGVVGYGMALLFIIYGAPDLALTQFLIETLTIILIALIAIKFPIYRNRKTPFFILSRNILLSSSFGILMTLILWKIVDLPFNERLSHFFAQNSYLLGKGRNIVNVILVDFRGLDTLGEITVLVIGSMGVLSLIKLVRRREASK